MSSHTWQSIVELNLTHHFPIASRVRVWLPAPNRVALPCTTAWGAFTVVQNDEINIYIVAEAESDDRGGSDASNAETSANCRDARAD